MTKFALPALVGSLLVLSSPVYAEDSDRVRGTVSEVIATEPAQPGLPVLGPIGALIGAVLSAPLALAPPAEQDRDAARAATTVGPRVGPRDAATMGQGAIVVRERSCERDSSGKVTCRNIGR